MATKRKAKAPPKPPLYIEWMRLDDLESRLDPENQKDHDVGALLESFETFGFTKPVLINEETGKVLAGHGRIKTTRAAFDDGRDPPDRTFDDGEIWWMMVIRGLHMPKAKGSAYLIADNRQVELGGWDEPKRLALLEQLARQRKLKGTGYDADDVDRMARFHRHIKGQPNEGRGVAKIKALQAKWKTKAGQLWGIPTGNYTEGQHRLLIADSTKATTWTRLMAGKHGHLIFTDPPYGVDYTDRAKSFGGMLGDDQKRDELTKFLSAAFKQMVKHTVDQAAFYIFHASSTRADFTFAMKAVGLQEIQYLIWAKDSIVLGWSDYRWAHEPLFYASKAGERPAFYGDRGEPTVWRVESGPNGNEPISIGPGVIITDGQGSELFVSTRAPKRKLRHFRLEPESALALQTDRGMSTVWEARLDTGDRLHPTQKPVALAERAIINSSRLGEIVLDGFLGSGSTMVAAERQGRLCYGLELDTGYAAAVLERMSELDLEPKVIE
jgi:DNA modification methylase